MNRLSIRDGGYGEEVITALCGSAVTGSIPVSPPYNKESHLQFMGMALLLFLFDLDWILK